MKLRAFSLIELLVVMTLIGIFASLAAPSFMSYQRNRALYNSVRDTESFLSDGFAEARSQREPTRVILSNNTLILEYCDRQWQECEIYNTKDLPNIIETTDFVVDFLPPYGDISSLVPHNGVIYFILQDKTHALYINQQSGLVYSQSQKDE